MKSIQEVCDKPLNCSMAECQESLHALIYHDDKEISYIHL